MALPAFETTGRQERFVEQLREDGCECGADVEVKEDSVTPRLYRVRCVDEACGRSWTEEFDG